MLSPLAFFLLILSCSIALVYYGELLFAVLVDHGHELNEIHVQDQVSFNADTQPDNLQAIDELAEGYLKEYPEDSISLEAFEQLYKEATNPWKSRGATLLIQILNNTLHVEQRHFTTYLPWDKLRAHHIFARIQSILQRYSSLGLSFPNVELLFNPHDCPLRDPQYGPVFAITKCTGMKVLPVPQWFAWRDGSFTAWNQRMDRMIETGFSGPPWTDKQSKAVFRGNVRPSVLQFNLTQQRLQFINITSESFDQLGRTKIYVLGERRPDLLDVGLYGKGLDGGSQLLQTLGDAYRFRPPIPMSDQANHFKYVLYAEGACGWADRLKLLLVSGMLIFLQETPCKEFFQPLLQPWIHYVPVANDFSNLIERLEWAQTNDDVARDIVDEAALLGRTLNSQASWDQYLERLLLGYSRRLAYTPVAREGTKRFIKECKCPNRRDLQCDDSSSFQHGR